MRDLIADEELRWVCGDEEEMERTSERWPCRAAESRATHTHSHTHSHSLTHSHPHSAVLVVLSFCALSLCGRSICHLRIFGFSFGNQEVLQRREEKSKVRDYEITRFRDSKEAAGRWGGQRKARRGGVD
eukprot:scaffold4013_cov192-Ochromonas_danica.AAC.7